MKQLIVIMIILIGRTILFGQLKSLDIPNRITKNKSLDFRQIEQQNSKDFDIKLLYPDTTFDEFYRLSNTRQIIEVWKIDSVYAGQVINFTRTYVSNNDSEKFKSELIYNKVGVSADTAFMIFNKFQCFDSIPDMEKIKGWGIGFDGVVYCIESSTKKEYALKYFWRPTAQNDSIRFKKEITSFIEFIDQELNLYRHYEMFTSNLPNGSYTDGFIILTKTGKKNRKKK